MADTNTYTSKQNIKKYTTQAKFDAMNKSDIPVGTEYNIVGVVEESDLSAELQTKVNVVGHSIYTSTDYTVAEVGQTGYIQKSSTEAKGKGDVLITSNGKVGTILRGEDNSWLVLISAIIVGPQGPAGPAGADGPAGPQGPKGDPGGVVRAEISSDLILRFMGNNDNIVPYGFYAPTTSSISGITPTDPTFDMSVDIMVYESVYLYERVAETDSSKLIKNVTPLILTRGSDGFSGAVLMKAPALNDADSDVYFVMNVSWADGETMLAQINGLRLDLRITDNENGEFVGHIIIPSAKWAEGTITFEQDSLVASGLDYRELPAVFANQNSVYIFHQAWENADSFQGIEIKRADTIDGSYSPVMQSNVSIDIVPYSI